MIFLEKSNKFLLLPIELVVTSAITKAGYKLDPRESGELDGYRVFEVPMEKLTKEALKDSEIKGRAVLRSKNMIALGLISWVFNRPLEDTVNWINKKSLSKPVFQAIQRLSVGEISEPIIIQNTALILKLNDKRVSKSNNFNKDDLRKKIIEQKKNELFQLYSKSYLSQLKNNILIEYK